MLLRKAEIKDAEKVNLIYKKAKEGMKAAGINQWQDGYPNKDSFLSDVKNGIAVVIEDEGEVIATAAAYLGHENTYDYIENGKWITDNETYGLIHRIAVMPNIRNRGLASKIFSYVDSLCLENNLESSRCDTHRDNKIMQHTLEKNVYVYCGIIYLENGDERFGYEKLMSRPYEKLR